MNIRPPIPPFNQQDAELKVRLAENAWNSQLPEKIALAYSPDSQWQNRNAFFRGRKAIIAFLTKKWEQENNYRLIKELWAFNENRIAVRFAYEWSDTSDQWFRAYGNENWEFDQIGQMRSRYACINDLTISHEERLFHWPPGSRPDNHPGLSALGL